MLKNQILITMRKKQLLTYSLYKRYYEIIVVWKNDQKLCNQQMKKRYSSSMAGS